MIENVKIDTFCLEQTCLTNRQSGIFAYKIIQNTGFMYEIKSLLPGIKIVNYNSITCYL